MYFGGVSISSTERRMAKDADGVVGGSGAAFPNYSQAVTRNST